MKQFVVVLLTISTALTSASAKLGDNEDKINASYGKRIERRPRGPMEP